MKKRETPLYMKGGAHVFKRYLFSNPHAEEMKCSCGFVIWPVFSEEEAEQAVRDLGGDPCKCPRN